jgi:DnaJ homolog subfamily C member 17
MSSSKTKSVPEKDPYEVLGLTFGASDAEIAKAYRNLARTLHPDKLVAQKHLTDADLSQTAIRFHEIQAARAFLLNVEHAESRRTYDAKHASDRMRRAADKAREVGMTERRKRMRDELKLHEEQAASGSRRKQQQPSSSSSSAPATAQKDELERQGRELCERYAAKAAAAELHERNQAALQLQERQIRLKWSRKKLKAAGHASPSEDSIAKMIFQSCGSVEGVQMIGAKGNVALVTFHEESSCKKAVEAYATSDIWRATYVSKVKQREQDEDVTTPAQPQSWQRGREDVRDWKIRQAAEREALLRRMEQDEDDGTARLQTTGTARPFPPPFPNDYSTFTLPLDKLEKAEEMLLQGIVSDQSIQRMKIVH